MGKKKKSKTLATGKSIIALTVKDILEEQIAYKLA
jgi:hypothetical protein